MSKKKLITGVDVALQMSRAKRILEAEVIPRDEAYSQREKEGRLSADLIQALKLNA